MLNNEKWKLGKWKLGVDESGSWGDVACTGSDAKTQRHQYDWFPLQGALSLQLALQYAGVIRML